MPSGIVNWEGCLQPGSELSWGQASSMNSMAGRLDGQGFFALMDHGHVYCLFASDQQPRAVQFREQNGRSG